MCSSWIIESSMEIAKSGVTSGEEAGSISSTLKHAPQPKYMVSRIGGFVGMAKIQHCRQLEYLL